MSESDILANALADALLELRMDEDKTLRDCLLEIINKPMMDA